MNSSKKIFLDEQTFKRLETFLFDVEQRLTSMKSFYEKFYELIASVSQTHGTIFQELTNIKNLLNQTQIEQTTSIFDSFQFHCQEKTDDDRSPVSINKFQSKSVTDLNPKRLPRENSPTERVNDQDSLHNSTTASQEFSMSNSLLNEIRPSSSTSKRSSSLKKSPTQMLNRVKSPKSVSFNMDQDTNPPQPTSVESISSSFESKEIVTESPSTPIVKPMITRQASDFLPDLFQQHHHEITNKPNIGYQMGNATSIVRIHEIEPINGEYLRLLNTSNSIDYDLSGHFLQQNMACVPVCRFRFPLNTVIRAGQSITIWCGVLKNIEAQPPDTLVWKEQKQWELGAECVTILAKPTGKALAWTRSSHRIHVDPSSSDVFSASSKAQLGITDTTSLSSNSFRSASRLSTSIFIGNSKGSTGFLSTNIDHRSPIQQKTGISQLLNRPKSSPFSNHVGCKQDLIFMNILRTKGNESDQHSTVKI